MVNIHEILKSYEIEVPADKKADFDKAVTENYKTVAEVEKINDKLLLPKKQAHKCLLFKCFIQIQTNPCYRTSHYKTPLHNRALFFLYTLTL